MRLRTARRGFTLMEVLVGVAILAMMGLIIWGAMSVSLRGRRTAYRLQERYQTARVAMSRMVRELESAYISNHRNIDKYPKTMFLGRQDRIDFTYLGHLRVADGAKESDQGAVSYFLETDKESTRGTKALMRREKVPVDDRPEKGGITEKLAENVKSVEFEYWDPEDEDWKKDWKAELSDLDPVALPGSTGSAAAKVAKAVDDLVEEEDEFILPSRVRIHLVLKDDEGNEYPFESQARIYMRDPLAW